MTTLIAGESKQNDPLVLISEERCHAVLTHIRCDGESIKVILLKEGPRIHSGGVPDVATLRVSNDEMVRIVLLQIVYRALESRNTFHPRSLIEG